MKVGGEGKVKRCEGEEREMRREAKVHNTSHLGRDAVLKGRVVGTGLLCELENQIEEQNKLIREANRRHGQPRGVRRERRRWRILNAVHKRKQGSGGRGRGTKGAR